MQRKSVSLSLVALAALLAGCEWTSTSGSDSWSGSYDAMNFGGTYRITTLTTITTGSGESNTETTTTGHQADWLTVKNESGGTFGSGNKTAKGKTTQQNIVPGSVQISAGDYVWVDNGSGGFTFGGGSSGSSSGGGTKEQSGSQQIGTTSISKKKYNGTLAANLVEGSVAIRVGQNGGTFKDDGAGNLVGIGVSGSGSVTYASGVVQVTFDSAPPSGQSLIASYTYTFQDGDEIVVEGLSGSGAIQYTSGAWSLTVSPKMPSTESIRVTYSYYTGVVTPSGGGSTTTYTGINTEDFDPKSVTAITVTQTGQNLTMTLNNGVVMSGKFTSVRQTAAVSEDTGAGANTYNAQFQVSGTNAKMVGTLYYDYPTHNRILDGTWTLGKKTFDIHATGPAWTESGTSTAAETTYSN